MSENELSCLIRAFIIKEFKGLGAGLFENVYQHILKYGLEKLDLQVKIEMPFLLFMIILNLILGLG